MKTFKEYHEIPLTEEETQLIEAAAVGSTMFFLTELLNDIMKMIWWTTKLLTKIIIKGGSGAYYGGKWTVTSLYGRYNKLARATRKAQKAMKKAKSAEDFRQAKVNYVEARMRLETEKEMIDGLTKEEKQIYKADIAKINKQFSNITNKLNVFAKTNKNIVK